MDYFHPSKRDYRNHEIVYLAYHGNDGSIHLEDGNIDLDALADIANGFFENRIVHFSSCRTLADPETALHFKSLTNAKLVSGYTNSVNAMKSAIADMALFNDLMYIMDIPAKPTQSFRS